MVAGAGLVRGEASIRSHKLADEAEALATIDDEDTEPAGDGGKEARKLQDSSRLMGRVKWGVLGGMRIWSCCLGGDAICWVKTASPSNRGWTGE